MIELKRGHDLPQQDRHHGKIPIVSSSGVSDYHSIPKVKGPGVVTGRYGTLGQVYFVTEDFWPLNTTLYVCDFKGNDPRFVSYFLRSVDFLAYSDKAAVPGLNRNHLHQALVSYPTDIAEQHAIANILGTLDDKIDLNRRMNETLEAMARRIFKSWFLDFDPVRAKAEGRDPGLPKHMIDLFPDRFEDSELGEIPGGWHVSTIRELTSRIQYGLTRSAAVEPVGPKFLRITDIQGGRVDWGKVPYCNVSPEEYDRYRLKPGDILVARTGASTGENIYLPVVRDAIFASYLVRFQFDNPVIARLIGAFMRTPPYFDFVEGSIGGSAQPNASAQVLAGAKFVVPTRDIACRLSELVGPLDRRIVANNEESRTLEALRDTLLPKLISGELRVKDDESVMEAAV
jgi:type I restriction enzyme S subunit